MRDKLVKTLSAAIWLICGIIAGAGVATGMISADQVQGAIIIAASIMAAIALFTHFFLLFGIYEHSRRSSEATEKMVI